jgi:hypothetical protein
MAREKRIFLALQIPFCYTVFCCGPMFYGLGFISTREVAGSEGQKTEDRKQKTEKSDFCHLISAIWHLISGSA